VKPQTSYSDEIDFRKVLKELLAQKKLIIRGVVVCTAAAVVFSFLTPKSYVSSGFFQFKSVSIPSFKNYSAVFEDVNMLGVYIKKYHKDTTWVVSPSVFGDSFEPIYAYGKNPKNLMKDNTVLGVKITSAAATPDEARNRVETLGAYLETCLVNREIWKHYGGMSARLKSSFIESNASMIEHKISIDFLNKKIKLINQGLLKNDRVSSYDRQVVKLDATTEKYLPPFQQLIATRVSMNNIGVDMELLRRKMAIEELLLGYVQSIEGYLKDKSQFLIDGSLLDMFIEQIDEYFEDNKDNENTPTARYQIEAKLQTFVLLKNEQFKFVSGPTLPHSPKKPVKSLIVLVVFFASLVGFVTYGVFISWWIRED